MKHQFPGDTASWKRWFIVGCTMAAGVASLGQAGCSRSAGGAGTTSPEPPRRRGIVVLAGGGDAGTPGDMNSWSSRLLKHLLANGDVTGDGLIRVAVIGRRAQDSWPLEFWKPLGVDDWISYVMDTPEAADAPVLEHDFAGVDAVFIRGGDQGKYYDLWNGRRLEDCIRRVYARGGGVGGTSAGAMSLSEYALAGGTSLQSAQVLADAQHPMLDDETGGGSAVHADFLGFVPDALVDTHVTQRGRLGRMCGALARAVAESGRSDLYAIGLDQSTGVVIRDGVATVIGNGAVDLVRPTEDSLLIRRQGAPLVWTQLAFDRLTDGWRFDVARREPDLKHAPPGTVLVQFQESFPGAASDWEVHGSELPDERRFGFSVALSEGAVEPQRNPPGQLLPLSLGMVNVHDPERRGRVHEGFFYGLHEFTGVTGFLIGSGGRVWREADNPRLVYFGKNPKSSGPEEATLVVVTAQVRAKSLAPVVSSYDPGNKELRAAGLVGMRLHVVGDSVGNQLALDMRRGDIVRIGR